MCDGAATSVRSNSRHDMKLRSIANVLTEMPPHGVFLDASNGHEDRYCHEDGAVIGVEQTKQKAGSFRRTV